MVETTTSSPSLTDQLKADVGGSLLREIIEQFDKWGDEIKLSSNQGLPEEEFKSKMGLSASLDEAKEVVKVVWEMYRWKG